MEGVDIYEIAKKCRTSVEMIEKFYVGHIKTTLDASAINVVRAKRLQPANPQSYRAGPNPLSAVNPSKVQASTPAKPLPQQ
jgi:hypothetical protein